MKIPSFFNFFLRHAIITEKVKLLLTLYRPLPPPLFYFVKLKHLTLPPKKVSKNCTLSRALVLTACLIQHAQKNQKCLSQLFEFFIRGKTSLVRTPIISYTIFFLVTLIVTTYCDQKPIFWDDWKKIFSTWFLIEPCADGKKFT